MKMEKLIRWSISRKNTDGQRKTVIMHMKCAYGEMGEDMLPPIYKVAIEELSDDEIRLLDNLNHMFFKGEVAGMKL
jgi:hypothetical protein